MSSASSSELHGRARGLAMAATMVATVMQVIYTTLVTVALPTIQGELGATPEQGSWVLTSYLITSAVCMPLTGFFYDRLGMRRYMLICIGGFAVFTFLCGLATSLPQLVAVRVLQGAFGAAMVPLSQAIIIRITPPSLQARSIALWGLGVSFGPVLAPTIGGWVTDAFGWRWLFFMTVPVAAAAFWMSARFLPDTTPIERKMDWYGLALIGLGVGGLQFMLDRGNRADWFDATEIQVSALLSVCGFVGFIWHATSGRSRPLFSLAPFRNANFLGANVLSFVAALGMFGAQVMQPILMQNLLGYPIATTGLLMVPRGLAMAVGLLAAGRMLGRVDPRLIVGTGIVFGATGSYAMTLYTLDIGALWIIWPSLLQGLGLGLIFTPLTSQAFATLPKALVAEAAGVFSLVRTVGQAIGISVCVTVYIRMTQVNWVELGGVVQIHNPGYLAYLASLQLAPDDVRAVALVAGEIGRQAAMIAILDVLKFVAWAFALMLPFVFLLRGNQARK